MSAYRRAANELSVADLTEHYTRGLDDFRASFVPKIKARLAHLTSGAWDLEDYEAYAAGSDVDFMAHVVEAAATREGVTLYPGDWYGFLVGSTHEDRIRWATDAAGSLACLCVPSVRNGHVSEAMVAMLESAPACLLNINLFPTLAPEERKDVATALLPVLERSIVSVSFSRGFGLTASQLGVAFVHKDHPYRARFRRQWEWLTYFHNAIAARAFLAMDLDAVAAVDEARRQWAASWLEERGLPVVKSGSYYVKSFRVEGEAPSYLAPLTRDGLVRLCLKPDLV